MEEEIKDWIGLYHLPQVAVYQEVIWFKSVSVTSQKLLLLVWPKLLTTGLLLFEECAMIQFKWSKGLRCKKKRNFKNYYTYRNHTELFLTLELERSLKTLFKIL